MSSVTPSALVPTTPVVEVEEPGSPPTSTPWEESVFNRSSGFWRRGCFPPPRPLPSPSGPTVPILLPAPPLLPALPSPVPEPVSSTPRGEQVAKPAVIGAPYRIPRSAPKPVRQPPVPKPSRTIQRIRRERGEAAERRALRAERRPKKKKFTCRLCDITCTSRQALLDHKSSRRHKNKAENHGKSFICGPCNREFDSQNHLDRHERGKYHLRVVSER